MKTKLLLGIAFSFSAYLLAITNQALAQATVTDFNNVYTVDVEPIKLIVFKFNLPSSVDVTGCTYNFSGTNAQNLTSSPVPNTVNNIGVRFNNVNANGSVTATLSSCNTATSNGVSATYSKPIRYLGNLGNLSLNGSAVNPQPVGCGTQTVTLSVGAATNATLYSWNVSNLPGWSIVSGQGTNVITATTSAGSGGTIQVTATRGDASEVSSSQSLVVSRPELTGVSITGSNQGCFNQSGTYSLVGAPAGASVTWNASGPLTLAGSTSTNATINYGSSYGGGNVLATVQDGCGHIANPELAVGVGVPYIGSVQYDGSPNTGPMAAASGSTHYMVASVSNSPTVTYTLGTTTLNGDINISLYGVNYGTAAIYVYGSYGYGAVNIGASNVCGSSSANLILYIPSSYRIASNPARESLDVIFTDTKSLEALPDQMEIVSEKTMKPVQVVNIKELFDQGGFKEGNKVNFDIRSLPRGIYYLKVINPRQDKAKQTEMTRILFE